MHDKVGMILGSHRKVYVEVLKEIEVEMLDSELQWVLKQRFMYLRLFDNILIFFVTLDYIKYKLYFIDNLCHGCKESKEYNVMNQPSFM